MAQRRVLYPGEINDSPEAAWRKTLEVFDESEQRFTELSLFPEDRELPSDTVHSIEIQLDQVELRRPRAPIMTLGNPSRTVYAYGKVRYKDAFGENRTTRYRFFYGGNEPPRRKLHTEGFIVGLLQPDTEGNQAG